MIFHRVHKFTSKRMAAVVMLCVSFLLLVGKAIDLGCDRDSIMLLQPQHLHCPFEADSCLVCAHKC